MRTLKTGDFRGALWDILSSFDSRDLNLVISGGSILNYLEDSRYESIDTSRWDVFFADERCNTDHLNYDKARPFLSLLRARVHPIIYSVPVDKDDLRNKYESKLMGITSVDICLLGVGDNGHICSLWPNSDSLDSHRLVELVSVDCPFSPDRITVTLRFINRYVKGLYFVIPPKNGRPKDVTGPHLSIRDRLEIEYTVVLPQE